MNTALVPIAVAVVAALGAYIAAARKLSGKIDTSEAADLWAESRSIRSDLREQNVTLQTTIDHLRVRLARLEDDNYVLRRELAAFKKENHS